MGISFFARADHITGGEMYYSLQGVSNGVYTYNVTLKFFMRCNSGRNFYNPAIIAIFDKGTNAEVQQISAALSNTTTISITSHNPCITNPPPVCYEVGYYNFQVSLPASASGYILASQVTYRIAGISNLTPGYSQVGALYPAEIPGTSQVLNGAQNNSAVFVGDDLVVVCADNGFSYSFRATDPDGDQLRYHFCDAYQSSGGSGGMSAPPSPPPFTPVPYGNGFAGSAPLGLNVSIDANTGLITGRAPAAGVYVVTVCVEEIRNGVVIATQRKDLQINIAPCTVAAAMLQSEYMLCRTTKTISIANLSTSPLISTTYWEFTNSSGTVIFTSTNPVATYTFADTGTYKIKLVINRGGQCSDSTTALARVYPGFILQFNYNGVCFKKPTVFTDATTTVYGLINSWNWDFGENNAVSSQQNPTYTYATLGVKEVKLIVTNTVGCRDTLPKYITIWDKPPITLDFKDTLICVGDAVQLKANGSGVFNWTPNTNIINANTASPTATPIVNTTYVVNLDDNGCLNKDSVKVRVTDHVDLTMMNNNITICQGDTIQLQIQSNGFKYAWTPAINCIDPNVKNPFVFTNSNTTYEVTSRIGGCSATGQVIVSTVPYPVVDAGPGSTICHNASFQLNASMNGNVFTWSPSSSLNNDKILNPIAKPANSTKYTLTVRDTLSGCPKPKSDTVSIIVLPPIYPFAGGDTAIIVGQPLQLNATGGIRYAWSPDENLSATNIASPIGLFFDPDPGKRYRVYIYNQANCVDSAFITVKVFKTLPEVFVPNAFTPNNDGKNDVLRPIAVGMKQIEYFSVYNRWGQLIFSSRINYQGWDGTIRGNSQTAGVYVWVVKAVDYMGKPYLKKGTVLLIR